MEYVFAALFVLAIVGTFFFVVYFPIPDSVLGSAITLLVGLVVSFGLSVLFWIGVVIARALGI